MSGSRGVKQVFVTGLTANDASPKDQPGDIRWDGNKCYKYIQYKVGSGTVAAVAASTVVYTDVMYPLHQVTMDQTDGKICAGVLQAALAADYYGWIQIKGPCTLAAALTAGADGDALTVTGSSDGTLDVSASVVDHIAGYAIDISAKQILLDCPY